LVSRGTNAFAHSDAALVVGRNPTYSFVKRLSFSCYCSWSLDSGFTHL